MRDRLIVHRNNLSFHGKSYICAIGKNGVTENKKEGDSCTPMGVFYLRECWYRADRLSSPPVTKLPIRDIRPEDKWCDAPEDTRYNQHFQLPALSVPSSFEELFRQDHVYDIIIPLGYNDNPVIPGKGSAIFMHLAKADYAPTEGCIAISLKDMLEILPLLDTDTQIEVRV